MRLPDNVSPAAAARRSLLFDAAIGVAIGLFAIIIAAGIGVVGFFALLAAIVVIPWYLIEGSMRIARRRRASPAAIERRQILAEANRRKGSRRSSSRRRGR